LVQSHGSGFDVVSQPGRRSREELRRGRRSGAQRDAQSRLPTLTINNLNPTGNLRLGTGINVFTSTKPTANESLTWVGGNHTYKFGAEWALEGATRYSYGGG